MGKSIQNLDEVIDQIKHADPADVARCCNLGIARKKQRGKTTYVCPECGNGTGKDGTGIEPAVFPIGVMWKCFRCGKGFDNISLFAHAYNMSTSGEEFIELCILAADQLGIPYTYSNDLFDDERLKKKRVPLPPPPSISPDATKRTDWSKLIAGAEKYLDEFLSAPERNGVWRGLTAKTLKHYHCGFFRKYGSPPVDVVIIPFSQYSYMTRMTQKIEDLPEDYKTYIEDGYVKTKKFSPGTKDMFGFQNAIDAKPDEYVFVVEGAIDAMSGCQALGADKFIALNGSSVTYYYEVLFGKLEKGKHFIVMLDNDEAGRMNAQKVADKLIDFGHYAIVDNISEKYKDMNDFLQADENGLRENLLQILSDAKEKFAALKIEIEKKIAEKKTVEENQEGIVVVKQNKFVSGTTKELIASCPIDLEVPFGYTFSRYGVEIYKKKNSYQITSTPIVITRIFLATQNTVAKMEYAVYDRLTDSWSYNVTDTKTIADHRKIINLVDNNLSFVQDDAKHLSRFLIALRDYGFNFAKIPKSTIYLQPGWRSNSCEDFIFPISKDDSYIVSGNNYDYKGGFAEKGDVAEWIKNFNMISGCSGVARLVIGAALAAPLLRVCDCRNFTLHLDCPSGNGKTAVIKFALSVFGNPEILNRTFNGTFNSYEGSFVALNDFPSGIDELQAANKNARENMTSLLYNFGEGKTRGRMNKDATNKPIFRYHGVLLTTAEQPLTGENTDMGAKRRTLEISCRTILGEGYAHMIHESLNHNYGFFGRQWIKYIHDNKDKIRAEYEQARNKLARAYPDIMADYIFDISIAVVAGYNFCKMLGDKVDEDTLELFTKEFNRPETIEILPKLPAAQQMKNSFRAINVVIEFLYSHPRHFKKAQYRQGSQNSIVLDEEDIKPSDDGNAQEFYGIKLNDSSVLFFPAMLRKLLDDANFPNANAIIRAFAEEGYLITGNDKGHPYQKQVRFDGGKRLWANYFKPEVFKAIEPPAKTNCVEDFEGEELSLDNLPF